MVGGEVQSKVWGGPQGPGAAGPTPPGTAEAMADLRAALQAMMIERDEARADVERLSGVADAIRAQRDEARCERDRAVVAHRRAEQDARRQHVLARRNFTAARLGAQLLSAAGSTLRDSFLVAASGIRAVSDVTGEDDEGTRVVDHEGPF